MTLAAAPFLRKVASWGLSGVHDLPQEIPSQFVSTELQTLLADLAESGAWDRDGRITDVRTLIKIAYVIKHTWQR